MNNTKRNNHTYMKNPLFWIIAGIILFCFVAQTIPLEPIFLKAAALAGSAIGILLAGKQPR